MSRSVGRAVAGALGAGAVYAAAVPWVFRPWFLAANSLPKVVGSLSALSTADLHLNLWILAWVAHAAVVASAHIFDGNVYHPAANVITGSENMLAHLPVTVPVLLATGDPAALLKAVALESFTLTGLAMFLLVRHHTGSAAAALVAGAAYAFTPIRAITAPWPQYFGIQGLAFAMLAVDCWLARRRRRALVGLAASVTFQGLASVYVGGFTVMLLPVYAAVRLRSLAPGERAPAALRLGAALAVGVLLLVPAALPYVIARRAGVIPSLPAEALGFGSLLPSALFLSLQWIVWTGAVAPALAAAGVLVTAVRRWRGAERVRPGGPSAAAWAMAAVALLLAFGPYTFIGDKVVPTPYLLLHRWVPGFATFRAPIRFMLVCSAALSALGGYALARALAGRAAALRWIVAAALVVIIVLEAAPSPSPTTVAGFAEYASPVYRTLAARPPGEPVAELPAQIDSDDMAGMLANAYAMSASTIHWQPLVNGYTAYEPLVAPLLRGIMLRLPDQRALQALVDVTGARWLLVHRAKLRPERAALWPSGQTPPGLDLVQRSGTDDLYAITLPQRHDWTPLARASADTGRTFEGTPKAPLPPSCRRGRLLDVSLPPRIYPLPVAIPARVRFANDGDCTWPGIDSRADGLVVLRHRWHRPDGTVTPWNSPSRLIADVPPGAVVDDLMAIGPANAPLGRWTCEVELRQEGVDEPIARAFVETELVAVGQPAAPAGAGTTR